METIILVSVLATLGVVGIVGSVLVMFIKLRSKVDVSDYEAQIESIHRRLDEVYENNNSTIESVRDELHRSVDHLDQVIGKEGDDIRRGIDESLRFTDSRCDKLYAEMHNLNT
jgi:hypothetical protein